MIDTSRSMTYHIGNLNNENAAISKKMATGNAIDKGSDDAILHARLINVEDKLRVTENLKLQIDKTKALNNVADQNMGEIKELIDNVKIDLMKALNDGMDRSDKKALSTNIKGIRENMIDLVGAHVDGEYLFSGSKTTTETLSKDSNFDTNGKVDFNGDGFLREIATQPGSYRDRGVTAYDVSFYTSDRAVVGEKFNFSEDERVIDENGNEWKLNSQKNSLQQYDYNGKLTNPLVELPIFVGPTKEAKVDLGMGTNTDANGTYKITIDGNDYTYTGDGAGGDDTAAAAYATLKPLLEADGYVVGNLEFDDQFEISHPTAEFSIGFSDTDLKYDIGVKNEIEASKDGLSKQTTYSFNVPTSPSDRVFEAKHNYFDELNMIINALEGFTTKLDGTRGAEIEDSVVDDVIQSKLDITSRQYDATNIGHGELGGRNKIFELAHEKLETQVTHYNKLIQNIGGADMAKLAMESKSLELTFQALYSTIAKMNQLSLVNYVK